MVGSKTRFHFFILKLLYLARLLLAFLCSFFSRVELEGGSCDSVNENSMKMNLLQTGEEEGKSEMYLKFKFPTYEEFRETQKERGNCEFQFGESSIHAFIDDVDTFPVKEINVNDNRNGNLDEISFDSELGHDEIIEIKETELEKIVQQNEESHDVSQNLDENPSVSVGYDSDGFENSFLSETDFGEEIEIKGNDAMTECPSCKSDEDFLSERDFDEHSETKLDDEDDSYSPEFDDDDDDSDSLWEHQELVEQLKMELKKVRASGLPTILEESEASPKILMDNLKPWKMEDFQRQDCIGELHKFYKSYRERMRKFDIVSFQKMYAMGCLQLKDPLQSVPSSKTSSLPFKSLLSKNKIHGTDPMKKFVKELRDDMETVYVAHMCLSWEFLQWQYEKALDLWDADPDRIRKYNEVAGEFQQFQVLMQRFIEEEPFRGPRTEHYINTRRVHRNLLQVPVIRPDNLKNKRKGRRYDQDEYVINSDTLVEILEESLRLFWQFVRADKDCAITSGSNHKNLPEFSSPEDLKLLTEAKKMLQKKERKLRDVLRTKNCILKKCKRRGRDDNDDGYGQVLCFFSQVDMRLVSRTLNMSKITREQLVWCHEKMNRMGFVDRRIYVEPAFLLFPC